jgi:hypothetical protein
MTALLSRTRAVTLAALLVVSAIGAVAIPAAVGAQPSAEPNDDRTNATPIDPGKFVSAEQNGGNDTDWYRFPVENGEHIRVISGEGNSLTPELALYGPDGTAVDSGSGSGTVDAVVAGTTDAAAGTYYLKATPSEVADGSYSFVVEAASSDGFEPNGDRASAVAVEAGDERSGVLGEGNADWFAIDPSEGEHLTATLSLSSSVGLDNNAALALYDPDGNPVGENPEDVRTVNAPANETSRFDSRFTVTQSTVTEETGTYYVRVTGVDTTGFTRYDLTTSVSGSSDNSSDGSDEGDGDENRTGDGSDGSDDEDGGSDEGASAPFDDATAVDSLSAIPNGEIDADGNADVYAFELTGGSQIEISQGIGGGATPVALLDENGNTLGRIADRDSYTGAGDLLRANASDTGTYYLRIDGEAGERYSISGSVTNPDANEPNDERSAATEIDVGGADRGTLVRGDADYYAIGLEGGETMDVLANGTAASELTVYGPGGATIESVEVPSRSERDAGRPVTTVTAEDGGTYYLELSISDNAIGNVNSEYAIELASVDGSDNDESNDNGSNDSGSDDGTENDGPEDDGSNNDGPDDDSSENDESGEGESGNDGSTPYDNATTVDSLGGIEGEIGDDGTADVYAVSLTEESQVQLSRSASGGVGRVAMIDRNGTVLDVIPDTDTFTGREYTLRANATDAGTYYLKIEGNPGAEYGIGGSVTEPDGNEPDDSIEDATGIDLGEREQGTIVVGDEDVYTVSLDEGEAFAVEANGTAQAVVTVNGPDGERIAAEEVLFPGGYEEGELGRTRIVGATTAEQDGTYSFVVSIPANNTGDVNGEYDLAVVDASDGDDGAEEAGTGTPADSTTTAPGTAAPTTDGPETTDDDPETTDGESSPSDDDEAAATGTSMDVGETAGSGDTADGTTTESSGDSDGDGSETATEEGGAATDETDETDETNDAGNSSSGSDGTTTTASEDDATATTGGSETTGDDADSTDDEGGTTTGETNETSTSAPGDGAERTAVDGPGFGLLAALLAILSAVTVARGRD